MKKLFISQPMQGRSEEEVLQERARAIAKATAMVGEVEALETFFEDDLSKKPLDYLADSLHYLARADIAFFIGDWKQYRGCLIEYECAKAYGIAIIEE